MNHKNGKVSLINFIQAPSFIGELGLIGVENITKSVEVLEDCVCLALPLKIVSNLYYKMQRFTALMQIYWRKRQLLALKITQKL